MLKKNGVLNTKAKAWQSRGCSFAGFDEPASTIGSKPKSPMRPCVQSPIVAFSTILHTTA